MTKYVIEVGTEVIGNINYEVSTSGEYDLLDFVPCHLKLDANDSTCMFLAATVLGIEENN